jgi:ribosomal protein L22
MTEKNYNPNQKERKQMKKSAAAEKKESKKVQEPKKKAEEEKPEEKKEKVITKPKVKKNEAVVNSYNAKISTKYSKAMCKFIKRKTIPEAIKQLNEIIVKKRVLPMTGEIAHKKGKGMMSGKYPVNCSKEFIQILKTLQGNANVNELNDPVITEAICNVGKRPYGRFGRWQRKRTHLKIVAKEKKK